MSSKRGLSITTYIEGSKTQDGGKPQTQGGEERRGIQKTGN